MVPRLGSHLSKTSRIIIDEMNTGANQVAGPC